MNLLAATVTDVVLDCVEPEHSKVKLVEEPANEAEPQFTAVMSLSAKVVDDAAASLREKANVIVVAVVVAPELMEPEAPFPLPVADIDTVGAAVSDTTVKAFGEVLPFPAAS